MIRLGLCSGACITRDIEGVIRAASAARLDAVEWAADLHIGAGDIRAAEGAMMATLRAGLTTASYATLYRAGAEKGDYSRFDALLKITSILNAPIMRLFACPKDARLARTAEDEAKTLADLASALRRLGDRAAEKGITLCLSMGRGTSLDGYRRGTSISEAVGHDFVRLAWEDLPGFPAKEATAALESQGRFAGILIARCAGRDGTPRAVSEGEADWRERARAFKRAEMDPNMGSFVLLGAARAEGAAGEESLAADAMTLRGIVAEVEAKRA
jgi:hypothetical protein